MDVLKVLFDGIWELANREMDILGYFISPLDFWVSIAILYMLVDLMMWSIGWEKDND